MSLTSQLRDPESPVRRFFLEFADKNGLRKCFVALQSSKPLQQPVYQVREKHFHAVIGTTIDYLIRYVGLNNTLDFENTTAFKPIKKRQEKLPEFNKDLKVRETCKTIELKSE